MSNVVSSHITKSSGRLSVVHLSGDWTTQSLAELEEEIALSDWPDAPAITLDASQVDPFDTGGAWMLLQLTEALEGQGKQVHVHGLQERYQALLDLVRQRLTAAGDVPPPERRGILERLGKGVVDFVELGTDLLAFTGETFLAFARGLRDPRRIRLSFTAGILQSSGVLALPIIGLLSFLLGIVIAYQGGITLQQYGANIFIVELVTITMFRELAPLIAAIIIAGRTGSAFTAEIGTMKVTEEIDALSTLGINPTEVLVLPKVVGLIIALPLLTVFADLLGAAGGMVMAAAMLDVSVIDFIARVPEAVGVESFVVGIGKAPVFAAIIAMVGCYQGFRVEGGAESVGEHTTTSVVQSIFLVIVADAGFSVLFSLLGI